VAQARLHGADDEDLSAAMDIGLAVNEGAARQTRSFVGGLLGSPVVAAAKSGCC
jgi:hypothetical protein